MSFLGQGVELTRRRTLRLFRSSKGTRIVAALCHRDWWLRLPGDVWGPLFPGLDPELAMGWLVEVGEIHVDQVISE